MKTIIHVNQFKIRRREDKPLTVKTYRDNREAREAAIIHNGVVVATMNRENREAASWQF